MSRATKKRLVMKELDTVLFLPESNQMIAKTIASRGNNLHEVLDQKGNQYLASMPMKFRNTVWLKRGQYVLVESIEEGDKVKAEIVNILDSDSVLYIEENGQWPEIFVDEVEKLKRSTNKNGDIGGRIDADMLPPSESERGRRRKCPSCYENIQP
uniref:Probable RNA-binding protein EIF1AD n=1 Tax=Panagrolaimus superbus TaxID=310955 RepID=A0A914Y979_9BILA